MGSMGRLPASAPPHGPSTAGLSLLLVVLTNPEPAVAGLRVADWPAQSCLCPGVFASIDETTLLHKIYQMLRPRRHGPHGTLPSPGGNHPTASGLFSHST